MKRAFLFSAVVSLLFCASASAQDFVGRQKVWNYWDASGLLVGTRYVSTCNGYQEIIFGASSGASMTLADHQPCDNPTIMVAPTSDSLYNTTCTFGYYSVENGQITGVSLLPDGECVYNNAWCVYCP